jgi:hypothetical protein
MALAVAEAHRVLRSGGLLLDLHPQDTPLGLELWQPRSAELPTDGAPEAFDRRVLGQLAPESMQPDFAASTQALAAAAGHGFQSIEIRNFDYLFFFDTLDDLTHYLEENEELDLADDELLEGALLALQQAAGPAQLVLVQPVIATCLRKT